MPDKKIYFGLLLAVLIFLIVPLILPQGNAWAKNEPNLNLAKEGDSKSKDSSATPTPEGIVPSDSRATIPNPLGKGDLNSLIVAIFNVAYAAAGLVAIIFLIVGGYRYITSQGNPDAVEQAKGTIVNSIIGLIVVFTSYLVIHYVLNALGI